MKKKKENLWQLLKRLDEEAGQYNFHIHEANRYFDTAANKTAKIMDDHEQQLHKTIDKARRAIRSFLKKNKKKKK